MLGRRQPLDVAEQRVGLGHRPELDERVRRDRGVAQPAVAVVPVADAADLLRQARRGGGQDRAALLVAEAAQRERAARDLVAAERGQAQPVEPAAPGALRALAALGLRRRVRREAVAAAAQLEHVGTPALDARPGHLLDAVVLDLPGQARRVERDRIGGAEHLHAVGSDPQRDRRAAEVGARGELDDRLGAAFQHAHEPHAPVGIAAVEVVLDDQPRPARLERERARDVALRRRRTLVRGPHGERAGRPAAHQLGEQRRAVGSRVAQPGDARVGRHERDRVAVGEHRVALDRHGVGARQPFAAALDQARQQARDVVGAIDAELGERRAAADLDAEIGSGEAAERVLVGHVVADEDRGRGADLVADRIERVALVGLDDGELDHLLALAGMHARQPRRALAHRVERGRGVLLAMPAGSAAPRPRACARPSRPVAARRWRAARR